MPTHASSLQACPEGSRLSLWRALRVFSHGVCPRHNLKDLVNRAKFVVRGLSSPKATQAWFELIATPALAVIPRAHPHIFSKIHRPYLHRHVEIAERMWLLDEHYRFLLSEFSAAGIRGVYSPAGFSLASWEMEDVGPLSLRLHYSDHLEKEGELALGLFDETRGVCAFRVAFLASAFDPRPRELFIGGIQGRQRVATREWVVSITRGMHGLRPKALLLLALQTLAQEWGMQRILAVSDDAHVYRHWSGRRVIPASYDSFWVESGGERVSPVAFSLPLRAHPRILADVKPNKRTMYRRRYGMLDALSTQIRVSMQFASPGALHCPRPPESPGFSIPLEPPLVFARSNLLVPDPRDPVS
ncbi:MAG: DUF535 family protein [Verrucomicrobia bacterium]|nr:DUF535 family protein [Verrucomicrobiota bacterium]MBI3870816.1 DUF535 family protein [Verrucomicrobiota bacterium]